MGILVGRQLALHQVSVNPMESTTRDGHSTASPLWPAQLDHVTRISDRSEALVEFYSEAIGMAARQQGDGLRLLEGARSIR